MSTFSVYLPFLLAIFALSLKQPAMGGRIDGRITDFSPFDENSSLEQTPQAQPQYLPPYLRHRESKPATKSSRHSGPSKSATLDDDERSSSSAGSHYRFDYNHRQAINLPSEHAHSHQKASLSKSPSNHTIIEEFVIDANSPEYQQLLSHKLVTVEKSRQPYSSFLKPGLASGKGHKGADSHETVTSIRRIVPPTSKRHLESSEKRENSPISRGFRANQTATIETAPRRLATLRASLEGLLLRLEEIREITLEEISLLEGHTHQQLNSEPDSGETAGRETREPEVGSGKFDRSYLDANYERDLRHYISQATDYETSKKK